MTATSQTTSEHGCSVRFVLDGDIIEIEGVDPNRTVLQYLREDLDRTGTKEGCAEGDCGACTVVVAEIDESGKHLRSRAINSCIQFLPTLDGKELLTVESLDGMNGNLHPVQQAMVDCHGSQCGFCTPGFVMSLFALFKNDSNPGRRQIDEALAGNLCRCTGYKPIVAAATAMYQGLAASDDWRFRPCGDARCDDEVLRISKLREIRTEGLTCIDGAGREFFAPRSMSDLSDLVVRYPSATILAGGTDVGLWVTKQHRSLDTIIYVGGVPELNRATVTEKHIDIGAAVSLSDAVPLIVAHYPPLEELFVRFASPPIRNAATLGGNIANASPIGDSMPALMALQTELRLCKGNSTRTLALSEFYIAYQETALQAGEFIERILIPLPADDRRIASYKISKRFDQDISAVCAAFSLRLVNNKIVSFIAAYGGMAATPARATNCEDAMLGREWNNESIVAAMAALDDDFEPLTDMRSSAAYRSEICRNLLQRFYLETEKPGSASVYTYGR